MKKVRKTLPKKLLVAKYRWYARQLPSGNQDQIPIMEENLDALGVRYTLIKTREYDKNDPNWSYGAFLFWIREDEVAKLPVDNEPDTEFKGPYISCTKDDPKGGGHSVYPIKDPVWFSLEVLHL